MLIGIENKNITLISVTMFILLQVLHRVVENI